MSDEWTKDNYTIGEVSRIFNIHSKMLRYWDRIELLKPYRVDKINCYRYYSSSQFYLFNFIRYLRKLGVPYNKIKTQLNKTNITSLEDLLREQISETEKHIKELTNIKKTFINHISDIENALDSVDLEKVAIEYLPEHKIVMVDYSISNRQEFELAIRKLENVLSGSPILLVSQVATIMSGEDFRSREYLKFKGVSIPIGVYNTKNKYIITRPEGEYAILHFWGDLNNSDKYYDQLLNHIDCHGYRMCGDLIRRCIAPGTLEGKHDHLAEICISIEKTK